MHNVIVAGVIKHFEMTYEMAWKFLRIYLEKNVGIEVTDSRSIFRACYENKILPKNVTDALLELVEERNLTVHIYDMATAQRICRELVKYFFVFEEIAQLKVPA